MYAGDSVPPTKKEQYKRFSCRIIKGNFCTFRSQYKISFEIYAHRHYERQNLSQAVGVSFSHADDLNSIQFSSNTRRKRKQSSRRAKRFFAHLSQNIEVASTTA